MNATVTIVFMWCYSGVVDLNSSENMVIITQLREELEALKKQVIMKDQQILERDKKVRNTLSL